MPSHPIQSYSATWLDEIGLRPLLSLIEAVAIPYVLIRLRRKRSATHQGKVTMRTKQAVLCWNVFCEDTRLAIKWWNYTVFLLLYLVSLKLHLSSSNDTYWPVSSSKKSRGVRRSMGLYMVWSRVRNVWCSIDFPQHTCTPFRGGLVFLEVFRILIGSRNRSFRILHAEHKWSF